VKHDGWRAQPHRSHASAVIFGKNGKDISGRFHVIRDAFRNLPPCIIDAEIVGSDADGVPDFRGLMAGNSHGFCAWCFDLLMVDGKDVRGEPLDDRRGRLEQLLSGADPDLLRFSARGGSETRPRRHRLKEARSAVCVRPQQRLGECKTAVWWQANRDRREMFERR